MRRGHTSCEGRRRGWRGLALVLGLSAGLAAAEPLDPATEVEPFVRELVERHQLPADEVRRILRQARVLGTVLEAMSRPAEARPWHSYRPIFLTPGRIQGGVEFWRDHAELLARAEREYGVAAEIMVAIIGVETHYGRNTGTLRVLDALATLAFRFPRRAEFFRRELAEFLVLAREEGLDPLAVRGSYAGAMGVSQFIPSSYRAYSVDFDGSSRRDLFASPADAIGSVANYLAVHGWERGEPVAFPARIRGQGYRGLLEGGIEPHTTLAMMAELGVDPDGGRADLQAALIELEGGDGMKYWVTLRNFYVITRYNRSRLYAMAVHQLAEAIKAERRGSRVDG